MSTQKGEAGTIPIELAGMLAKMRELGITPGQATAIFTDLQTGPITVERLQEYNRRMRDIDYGQFTLQFADGEIVATGLLTTKKEPRRRLKKYKNAPGVTSLWGQSLSS